MVADHHVELEQIQTFITVVHSGSVLRAAELLGVSRATVRRRLEQLEARAGVALLQRTRRGVVATDAGGLLAERGELIVREADALLASVQQVGAEPAGRLRVALPVGLLPQLLLPLIAGLRQRYPRVGVALRFADDPVAGLLRDADIAVHFGPRISKGPWTSYKLLRIEERLLASPRYLAEHGTPTSVEQLHDHQLLSWQAPGEDPYVWPTLRGAAIAVEPALISSDIHLLRESAAMGMGIAMVPEGGLPITAAAQGLVEVLPEAVGRDNDLWMVVPSALVDIPKVRVVVDAVVAFVKAM